MEEKERYEGQISKHSRICSSDMRLINYPKTQEQKVYIWDKELCNGAEWNDFLKAVKEKGQENAELKEQLNYYKGTKLGDFAEENQQLKQQLAESEKKREYLFSSNCDYVSENEELKQQLDEKKKEIESLRENSLSKRIFKEKLIPSHCMKQYEKYEQQIDKLTQDKISFAVEQLTQAIKNIKKCNYKDFGIMYQSDAIAVICNQINELKEGK